MVSVQIFVEVYLVGLEKCKNYLHGCILLTKGDKPLTHLDLCKKIDVAWKHLGKWKEISFGKGFYEFAFSSLEDMRRVLDVVTWNLSLEIFHIFSWTKDFVPASMKLIKTQC